MTITNRLNITLTPLRLHSASSVRIPNSINNFKTSIPALRLRPLNLLSASSVNLHGLANKSIFHNNLRVMLSPLKSPVLRKYSNPSKTPGMYPSISKCNAKRCNCCMHIYPPELQLNKANTSDTEAPFLDLRLSISNGFVSSKIYDKRDDFGFDIVNFPFLDGDVPRSTSYGVYISQLIRFARVSNHVVDFNARNKSLTAKLLQQGYRYHKFRKTFSKFYRRQYQLFFKFSVGLKTLLHQGLLEPEFYGDLVYKFKKNVGRADFSDQFRKIIVRYKRIGYNINIMRQSACLVFNPITVNNFASLFNCTPVGRASDSIMAPT